MTTISHDQYKKTIPRWKWQSDSDTSTCNVCQIMIKPTIFKSNKHHCRFCGKIVCSSCSQHTSKWHRICDLCFVKKDELKQSLIKLSQSIPKDLLSWSTSNAIKVNNHIFMFISPSYSIYYYNTMTNKWSQQKLNYHSSRRDAVAFNKNTKEIYSITNNYYEMAQKLRKTNIINGHHRMIMVQTIELSSNDNDNNKKDQLEDVKCVFINDEFHIIGARKNILGDNDNNKHYLLDDTHYRLIPLWSFSLNILKDAELIYLESKQTLYLFGGATKYIYKCCYSSTYNINNRCIWKKLNVNMPSKSSNLQLASCKNDKYILLFHQQYTASIEIYIFDVDKEKFAKSLVQCPLSTFGLKVFVPNDYRYKMSTLLFGFFHQTHNPYLSDYLPTDIINLIAVFIGSQCEYIYVCSTRSEGEFWKISIDYILKNSIKIQDN